MIPKNAKYIIETLNKHGYEAYIVGGAVRNYYMNKPVNDWDITTNAKPDIVESLFEKTISVGKAFGTIIVKLDEHYEVTTYRNETSYDGRKPKDVTYSNLIEEDLRRRDFTMNAMYMNLNEEIFDIHHGKDSIKKNIIETVGEPVERFTEDYLRVYRYVRFTCQYQFSTNNTLDNVIQQMPINTMISSERIREEFCKILLSDRPSTGIQHLLHLNLLEYIFPEIIPSVGFNQHSPYHHLTVFDHLMAALDQTPKDLIVRLAALCHDIGKPKTFVLTDGIGHFYGHDKVSVELTKSMLKRLKFDSKTIEDVSSLVQHHMRLLDANNKKSIKKFMNKIGIHRLEWFLDLRKADILSSKTNDDLSSIIKMTEAFQAVLNEKHPLSVKDLAVNGYDLIGLDISGPEIGRILNVLLEHVLEYPENNTTAYLTQLIMKEKEAITSTK